MNPFVEKLEKLISGEISEVKIQKEEMMGFLEAWWKRPERKRIVVGAAHGGNIIYGYVKDLR